MRRRTALLLLLSTLPATASSRTAPDAPPWRPAPPPVDDVIYFVLVDRFANGDPSNDGVIDADDPQAWHGGDIRGVIEHLDEIEELGVRTVWLSPVWDCRDEKFFEWGAFHGYWVDDLAKIDPRFGTAEELRELSDALHARGMRLVLDVVFNHVAMDSPLLQDKPHWFHPVCDIEDWNDPRQLTDCRVHGLPDLDQANADLYQHLLATSLHWIEAVRPDGFRIDAVRHLDAAFLRRFANHVRERAGPDFQLLGEDFQGDALGLARSFRAGGFSSMFDFPLHYAMLDVYCQDRPVGRLAATLSADREYDDPGALVPFLDNHDRPRLASACADDAGRTDRDALRQALTFLLTARGTPSLTYGTESGLTGAEEPANRADMRFEPRHATGLLVQRWLEFRRAHPALHSGATRIVGLQGELLVLARVAPSEAALIAVNRGDLPSVWRVPDELYDDTTMVDATTGLPWEMPTVSFPPRSTTVYLLAHEEPDGYAPLLVAGPPGEPSDQRLIRIVVPPDSATTGGTLGLLGSGPRLGNWDPTQAVGPFVPGPDGQVLDLYAPVGDVLEFKLILRRPDGTVDWQPGDNRYLLVEAGTAPAIVDLAW